MAKMKKLLLAATILAFAGAPTISFAQQQTPNVGNIVNGVGGVMNGQGGVGGIVNGVGGIVNGQGGGIGGLLGGQSGVGGLLGGQSGVGGLLGGQGGVGGLLGGQGGLGGLGGLTGQGGLGGLTGQGGFGGLVGGQGGLGGIGGATGANGSGVPFGGKAGDAPAQGCCYDYSNESTNRDKIIDSFTKQINAMQLAIIEALRLGTGQTTGNMREQTTAAHNLADVQDDRSVVGRVEQARLDAIKQAASGASTCNVATSASGGALSKSVEATRVAMTQQMVKWATGNGDSPTAQGPDIAIQARLQKHCSLYSSAADQISGLCQGGGGGQLENADVDISQSMFYSDQSGTFGTLPQERYTAAQHFLINALDPAPDGRMRTNEAATAVGRETAARNASNTARMSVASDTANFILASLAPPNGGGGQIATQGGAMSTSDWAKQTAPNVIGYGDRSYPNGLSWYDWMDLRSRAWFQNPSWMLKMDTQSGEQAQKDGTAILSFIAYQNWENYRLQQRVAMTLATMLAIQVDEVRGRNITRRQ